MKLLLASDDYCYKFNGDFYLQPSDYRLYMRYLCAFENVRYVFRTKEVGSAEELGVFNVKITIARMEIWPISFYQGPIEYAKHYFSIHKQLHNVCEGCQLAILRIPSATSFAVWKHIRCSIPYAAEVVGDCYDIFKNSKKIIVKMLWLNMHYRQIRLCNNAIGVACVTKKYLQSHYTSIKPDAVFSHYSSIELPLSFRFQPRVFPNEKKQFQLVHVSNMVYLDSGKGHKEIVGILKYIRDCKINVILTIVGRDYFGGINKITKYATDIGVNEYINFTGYIGVDKLREILLESDVMIFPTKTEGLPRVLIEAMALGLPCISTPVSSLPELIDNDFLIKYSDIKRFAEKTIQLLANAELYEQQSRINFERSREYCSDILGERRTAFYMALRKKVEKV